MNEIQQIHVERNFPPVPARFEDVFQSALRDVSQNGDASEWMRYHRYGEDEKDQVAARKWLALRLPELDLRGRIVLTNGAKNGVLLLLSSFLQAGDVVATEALSALNAWSIPKILGVNVVGVQMDAEGMLPEVFAEVCRTHSPKALFTVPTLHNPTTHILDTERRHAIASIARKHGVMIIEDDICGMLMPDAPPTFAELAPDISWFVTGVGKTLSPGFRLGYIVTPTASQANDFINRYRSTTTWVPSPLVVEVVSNLITNGAAFKLLDDIREETMARQSLIHECLQEHDVVSKPWALNAWLRLPSHVQAADFINIARYQKILLGSTSAFATDARHQHNSVRICIGGPSSQDQLREALNNISNLA